MKWALASAVFVGCTVGLTGAAASTSNHVWKKLHRPLRIPYIAPGARCPVTAKLRGPVVPLRLSLAFRYPPQRGSPFYGSPWAGVKIHWTRHGYRGPVLIRGRQLDGAHRLRFGRGQMPRREQRVRHGRRFASATRIESPGCYAYQVDGRRFSRIFVFEAKLVGPTTRAQLLNALAPLRLGIEPAGFYHSIAFDLLGIVGQRFTGPPGDLFVWQFPSFAEAQSVLIGRDGNELVLRTREGTLSASIFCETTPCPPLGAEVHWYRNGRVLVAYVGNDADVARALTRLLGEQFAGA